MALNVIYPASELPENVDTYLRGLYPEHPANIEPSTVPTLGSMLSGTTAICAVLILALVAGQSALGF